MSLQLALTQLETLAEMLNERKREAEQFQAFKEMIRHISSKFATRPLSDSSRYLLREDNVTQLVRCSKRKHERAFLILRSIFFTGIQSKRHDNESKKAASTFIK